VIAHTLRAAGRYVVALSAAEIDEGHTIVAVLVRPRDVDWQQARRLKGEIVVILDTDDDDDITEAIVRGADAVITTRSDPQQLLDAVDIVSAGGSMLSPHIARMILGELRGLSTQRRVLTLTPRETDILLSIEQGDSIKQTARTLGISEKTVQNLQSRLFSKLNARNRAQAVTRAHELGLLRSTWST
jgi:DNA-binding NarL/FixJ family response regulator